ncbi:MAG TPA: ankyrin repeat domain-containing protein [Polyangiaceae bacterium]|nr:ankyrin repeat domain-containing protein [Polyangiaceae bacterium]
MVSNTDQASVPQGNTIRLWLFAALACAAAAGCASGEDDALAPDVAELMVAADHDEVARIETLLASGTDVGEVDRSGRTALMHAAENGSMGALSLLLDEGADLESATPEGVTALMDAARSGRAAAVTVLATRGAILARLSDLEYRPAAIHLAAKEDHADCLEALLDAGADIDQLEGSASTPLMYAAYYDGPSAARFLIAAGADLNARDEEDLTALALAQDAGNQEIEALLLSAGAR